jgi:hypothetical protein
MGEVETAFAGHEELPPDRRLGVVERDLETGGRGDFRRAQTGWTAAEDGELGVAVQRGNASWLKNGRGSKSSEFDLFQIDEPGGFDAGLLADDSRVVEEIGGEPPFAATGRQGLEDGSGESGLREIRDPKAEPAQRSWSSRRIGSSRTCSRNRHRAASAS